MKDNSLLVYGGTNENCNSLLVYGGTTTENLNLLSGGIIFDMTKNKEIQI